MRYWPLTTILNSPLLPTAYALELEQFYHKPLSRNAFHSVMEVAHHTPAIEAPATVLIESDGAPNRLAYTDYPEFYEWMRLERTTVMEHNGHTFFLTAALH
jgi:hypothetical protein